MDFSVNEETFLREGTVGREVIEQYLKGCAGRIWADGCLPIFLLLPRRSRPGAMSTIRGLYIDLCLELNMPLFDGIALIDRIQCETGVSREALFEDDGHLHPWAAFALGRDLGRWLTQFGNPPWQERGERWEYHQYRFVEASEFVTDRAEIVRRSSALVTQKMISLEAGGFMEAEASENDEAVGLCTSLVETEGLIEIAGINPTIYDLSNAYPIYREGFLLSAQAFPFPVSPHCGRFTLKAIKRDASRAVNVPALIPQAEYARNNDRVVIGGLIVRNKLPYVALSKPGHNWDYHGSTTDMSQQLREAVLAHNR